MKNSAVAAMFAKQFKVPKDNVKVECLGATGNEYEFDVVVIDTQLSKITECTVKIANTIRREYDV